MSPFSLQKDQQHIGAEVREWKYLTQWRFRTTEAGLRQQMLQENPEKENWHPSEVNVIFPKGRHPPFQAGKSRNLCLI